MDSQERIRFDPMSAHGTPCIRGTRVPVSVIVDSIADEESPADIAAAYRIDLEDVRAALQYAAELVRGQIVHLPRGAA